MTAKHLEELLRNVQGGAGASNAARLASWRSARAQARYAYETWQREGGAAAYAAYLAAEDRADAALAALRLQGRGEEAA
jgi:hypothetical protein